MAWPAKILLDLPADAVCQVLVALDDAYDIAQTASVCTLLNELQKQAFVSRPHLAKVADLAKQVAQLEIDNAELQKHTIVPADQERLFAKLHTLEQAVEAQTARADAAEARCSKLLRWVEEQKDRAEKYKARAEDKDEDIERLEREFEEQAREEELLEEQLQEEKARAEKYKARAENYQARAEEYQARAEGRRLLSRRDAEELRREGLRTIRYRIDPETGIRRVVYPNDRPTLQGRRRTRAD